MKKRFSEIPESCCRTFFFLLLSLWAVLWNDSSMAVWIVMEWGMGSLWPGKSTLSVWLCLWQSLMNYILCLFLENDEKSVILLQIIQVKVF